MVLIWPNSKKGLYTCLAPSTIKTNKLATNAQKANLLNGLKAKPLNFPKSVKSKAIIIKRALNIAKTSRSLFGIERKIAYKGTHSWMIAAGVAHRISHLIIWIPPPFGASWESRVEK